MGPAPNSGIDHTPRKKDFTENRIHEFQTLTTRCWTFNQDAIFSTWLLKREHVWNKCFDRREKMEHMIYK